MEGILAKIFPIYGYKDCKVERLISNNVDMPVQACPVNRKAGGQHILINHQEQAARSTILPGFWTLSGASLW
jgi:hypothetical protein